MLQRKKQKVVIIEVSHSITTETWGLLLQIIHKPKISLLKTDSELFSCLCKRSLQVNTEVGNKQCKYILISIHVDEIYMQHVFFLFLQGIVCIYSDTLNWGMSAHSSRDIPRERACEQAALRM